MYNVYEIYFYYGMGEGNFLLNKKVNFSPPNLVVAK